MTLSLCLSWNYWNLIVRCASSANAYCFLSVDFEVLFDVLTDCFGEGPEDRRVIAL